MQPKNMPYYRGPCLPKDAHIDPGASADFADAQPSYDKEAHPVLTSIIVDYSNGLDHLANWPVKFGHVDSSRSRDDPTKVLYNADIPGVARQLMHFDWAIYGFNSGHLILSIQARNLPFKVTLASDPYGLGRALFREFSLNSHTILNGSAELLNHIQG